MDDSKTSGGRPEAVAPGVEGKLYVVATVHLDTQWRWTIQRTISEYLPATLDGNFALFEKYPHYVLSWEGAFRYMLIREYYPKAWRRLKAYAAAGRWTVAGTMLESVDVNLVSPESLIRQFLYGSRFFERELDSRACDVFLPDCFGFGYSLPSIAAHCGLTGFSSQKFIKWSAPAKTPFDVGLWEGPDGATLLAVLNPDGYGDGIDEDLSRSPRWRERLRALGEASGVHAGYKYFGVGDRGGAPDEESLRWLARSLEDPGPVRVVHGRSDQFFRDLDKRQEGLPRYRGELLLPEHGPGCYTSMASMKRWNRKNEVLADAAEKAASAAAWSGALHYPAEAIDDGWLRFLWHQMHDDLTGTSIPQAYDFSWNDLAIATNRFGGVLGDALAALGSGLDTGVEGVPLVVFNPLSIERQDPVDAKIRFDGPAPAAVRVYDPEGREVASQSSRRPDGALRVTFLATAPPVGCAVFDVRAAREPCALPTPLSAGFRSLENQRYRVEIHDGGDVSRIYDKALDRELLSSALRLELLPDRSSKFPAWELKYRDVMAEPRRVRRLLGCRLVESGPARVTLEVRRAAHGSTLVQRIGLAAGDAGDRLEIDTRLDWCTWGRMLKAAFPLAVDEPQATYDLGLGVIRRGVNRPELYEVPAQQWADLSSAGGERGVSILNDCKYGWDRPRPDTLRLTLVRSPWAARGHPHQATQDWAHHRFKYALYSHAGDWREGSVWQAARLNQPLIAWQARPRARERPRSFSFARVDSPGVAIRAIKRAESGERLVVRVQEIEGRAQSAVGIELAAPIVEAREIDGVERERRPAAPAGGALSTDLGPFELKSFALRLAPPERPGRPPVARAVRLPFDGSATSGDGGPATDFDGRGNSLPAELFPTRLECGGVPFELGPAAGGASNCLACRGQQIPLPDGGWERLFLLAASVGGDAEADFAVNGLVTRLRIADYAARIGAASHRPAVGRVRYGSTRPAFVRGDRVAWVATHLHGKRGANLPYVFGYLFCYALPVPPGNDSDLAVLELPREPRIRLFAASVARELHGPLTPAGPGLWPGFSPSW